MAQHDALAGAVSDAPHARGAIHTTAHQPRAIRGERAARTSPLVTLQRRTRSERRCKEAWAAAWPARDVLLAFSSCSSSGGAARASPSATRQRHTVPSAPAVAIALASGAHAAQTTPSLCAAAAPVPLLAAASHSRKLPSDAAVASTKRGCEPSPAAAQGAAMRADTVAPCPSSAATQARPAMACSAAFS